MNSHPQPSIGRRVAALRKLRGLTQTALAARLHRSESWVTKIERGERRIDSIAVLRELARALSVPLWQLVEADSSSPEAALARSVALAELQWMLDTPARIGLNDEIGTVNDLERETSAVRRLYDTARYNFSAALPQLPGLIGRVRHLMLDASATDRLRLHTLLVPLYRITSLELYRKGDVPRARGALDRALTEAEHSGDALVVGAAGALIVAFMVHREPASGVATAEAFIDLVAGEPTVDSPKGTLVVGALHSYAALAAARAGDATGARRLMASAVKAAAALGRDGGPHGVFFGPAYSAINETRLLVELGHAPEAVRIGEKIDLTRLASVNRAGFHAAYLAQAQSRCRQYDDALDTVAAGIRVAPEMFHADAHPGNVARDVVSGMLRRRRHVDERLRRIARYLNVSG